MFVVLTNIPTPYRTHFFNELAVEVSKAGDILHVLYCAIKEPNRKWKFTHENNKYNYRILKGFHPAIRGIYPHINFSVISVLRKLKPTKVLIAGSWNTPTIIFALFYLRLTNKKTIFWSEAHNDSVRKNKGIPALLRRLIFGLFDAFAVPNKRSKDYIINNLKITSKPVFLLPNTVNDIFFISKNSSEIPGKFGRLQGKKILVQVSQLEDRKGVVELVEAWFIIKKEEREGWVLVIAGSGSLYDILRSAIIERNEEEAIWLIGELNTEEIQQLLQMSQAFILATKNDPNPLSVIEAAFSALPLIVSNFAGNAGELVTPGFNGFLCKEISPGYLASIIFTVINTDINRLQLMGRRSLEIALKDFQSKEVARKLLLQIKEGL